LLSGTTREELIMGYLVGDVLALLARQRSRDASETLTLRSLLDLMRERLGKAFAAESWLLLSLESLSEPMDGSLDAATFEHLHSGQPALLALHVLFAERRGSADGLDELLAMLGAEKAPLERWRSVAAALVGALWAFWHGIESVPHELLRRQPACALAYDLGHALHRGG
jgi:hypothetical protein